MHFIVIKICIFLSFFALNACSFNSQIKAPTQSLNLKKPSKTQMNQKLLYADLIFEQNVDKLSFFEGFDADLKNTHKEFLKHFFAPFNVNFKNKKLNKKALFWSFDHYLSTKQYYFFNKNPIEKEFFQKALDNANTKALLKVSKKAIITQNTMLKNIPVSTAILLDPSKDGEGLPFDYALDSALNAGSAAFISHYTQDKKFAFVYTNLGWGFVLARDLEIFDDKRAQSYQKLHFITPLEEKMPILSDKGEFLYNARIGALYPIFKSDDKFYYGKIGSNIYKISKKKAALFPLKANDKNFKQVLNELLALSYGWGGYEFERDCSLLLRDLFAAFGVYLPRNSYAQAKNFENLDISSLNNAQKLHFIKKYAKAYASLLYLKGHITLFVGEINNNLAMFHSIWGLKAPNDKRLLIGKSVLTPVDIGALDTRVQKEDLILSRLELLSIFNLSKEEKKRLEEEIAKLAKE